MSTWPASKKCSYCQETGRPSHCGMCAARNDIDALERQLADERARIDCATRDGWLSDDLECAHEDGPACWTHLLAEAEGKLDAVARVVHGNSHAVSCAVLARILEGE